MTTILREVDAVVIGVGWTGSIMARELTKAGLHVVGLERGARRMPAQDFVLPNVRDDLKYAVRQELFQDTQLETVSLRHTPGETALPIRRLGSFLPGIGVGGAGAHWNGVTWRLLPTDHNLRTHLENRYGRNAIPAEMTIEDFPVSYDELEPYYDRFEKLLGVSGKAGNLRGQKIDADLDYLGRDLVPRPPLAHVNGVLTGIRNDGGIVEPPSGAYVLVIFLSNQSDEAAAENAIAKASAKVYATMTHAH